MDREQMKAKVIAQVDMYREAILALGAEIYKHPETGYREVRTTETVAKALEEPQLLQRSEERRVGKECS